MINFPKRGFYCLIFLVPLVGSFVLSLAVPREHEQGCSRYLSFENSTLDQLACTYGTDKASWGHDYAKIYDFYFSKLRYETLNFLEIGFSLGKSGRMWHNYFGNAKFHFIDINPAYFESEGIEGFSDRCHFHLVDQADERALREFAEKVGGNFDIICDDGGHQMHQQLTSFRVLFPYLKSGGMYIIEDLHTSYWQDYGGSGTLCDPKASPQTTIHFLKELVDQINFGGARTGNAGKGAWPAWLVQNMSYYQAHVESIHFYTSLCIIFKR